MFSKECKMCCIQKKKKRELLIIAKEKLVFSKKLLYRFKNEKIM